MKAMYAIAYIEAWKSQDFNQVWTRHLVIPVRRSNQLSYEDIDIGSWSFLGRKEPVRNEREVLYEIFHILNCRWKIKLSIILAVMKAIHAIAYIEAWKSQDFNRV